LLGGLLAAVWPLRLWVLSASNELNADEAIPGLMARHIADASELPVFYYGQPYFGALEAYRIAGLFALLGFHPWLVVVPAGASSPALIPSSGRLPRKSRHGRADSPPPYQSRSLRPRWLGCL